MATDSAVLGVIRASRPSFRNSHDRVAFAVHASFLAAGYSLTATGSQAASLSSPVSGNEEVGIEGWNEMDDAYAFCYIRSHHGATKSVIVKAWIIGDMLVVDAAPTAESDAKDHPEPYNLEINVSDYTTESGTSKNYAEHYKNLPALIEKINSSIISNLESSPKAGNTSSTRSKKETSGGQEATRDQPEIGFTSSHQPYSSVNQSDSSRLVYPPVPPIGGSDLFPAKTSEKAIFNCRFLTLMAVAGSLAGSMLCFLKGCAFVLDSFKEYFQSYIYHHGSGKVILLLVEAVDVYLMGTVMLIFGMGLYELFVNSLEIPDRNSTQQTSRATVCGSNLFGLFRLQERPKWLEIQSLDELKTKLGHVIVMVLLVGMFEKSKKVPINSGLDLLCFSGSVLLSSGSLFLLSKLNSGK